MQRFIEARLTKRYALSFLPVIDKCKSLTRSDIIHDAIAGVTAGLIAVPQALAYAKLAGLSVESGLYSAWAGHILYLIFGTSNSITCVPVAVLGLMLNPVVNGNALLASAISFWVAMIMFACSISGLSMAVELLSGAVTSGFTTASAITIMCTQIPSLLGLRRTVNGTAIPRYPPLTLYETARALPNSRKGDVILSAVNCSFLIAMLILSKRKFSNARVTLVITNFINSRQVIVVVSCILLTYLNHQVASSVTIVDKVPKGLPTPALPFTADMLSLLGPSIPIAAVAFIQHYSMAQQFACRPGAGRDVSPARELIALGFINLANSFVRGIPVCGSFGISIVAMRSGVRTSFSGVFVTAVVIVTITLLTPIFSYLPACALSSVILMSVVTLVDYSFVIKMWKVDKKEFAVCMTTILVGIFGDISYGIMAGLSLSIIMLLIRIMFPKSRKFSLWELEKGHTTPIEHAVVYRFEGTFNYPAIGNLFQSLEGVIEKNPHLPCIIFDLSRCCHMDFWAAKGIWKVMHQVHIKGPDLKLYGLRPAVRVKLECTKPPLAKVDDYITHWDHRDTQDIEFLTDMTNLPSNGQTDWAMIDVDILHGEDDFAKLFPGTPETPEGRTRSDSPVQFKTRWKIIELERTVANLNEQIRVLTQKLETQPITTAEVSSSPTSKGISGSPYACEGVDASSPTSRASRERARHSIVLLEPETLNSPIFTAS